mmetsp:Transcript_10425/g.21034  ORF Transcript_10425/g.21034 Transcript_10425/m.21034 type:complete len:120 (-) Transcript_10425:248-607(-)
MCWSIPISLASCVVGWTSCFILWQRGTKRSRWYANYLITYTFTQLVDIALWMINSQRPLQSCPAFIESFRSPALADESVDIANLVISKYLLPLVVFTQYWQQLSYPSTAYKESRWMSAC